VCRFLGSATSELLIVGGPNSVLNRKPTREFTFMWCPRFLDECFKVVVGCANKLGMVSRGCCVFAIFLKFPSKAIGCARS
jgi:hypothetical protein